MSHPTKPETASPFAFFKESKLTTNFTTLAAIFALLIAVAIDWSSKTVNASILDSRVSKLEENKTKVQEDVAVIRTKVEMILQHLEKK